MHTSPPFDGGNVLALTLDSEGNMADALQLGEESFEQDFACSQRKH
jgi:hypothetical protein